MKYALSIFIVVLLLTSQKQKGSFAFEVEVISCESKKKYDDWVYLIKDDKRIDSVNTYEYKDYLLFQSWVRKNNVRFKGLRPGEYQIKYTPKFNFDSVATVQIINRDERVKICYDEVPLIAYNQATIIDELPLGDTLYINAYVAAAGEFGGFDEGLWVWHDGYQLTGQFFSLANTYGMEWETDRVELYRRKQNEAKLSSQTFNLSETQVQDIKWFLVETRSYRKRSGISNAPEFITVYSSNDSYQISEHDFEWKPFLQLKEKITTANGLVYKQ